jgi:hypothetical protein
MVLTTLGFVRCPGMAFSVFDFEPLATDFFPPVGVSLANWSTSP